MDLHQQVFRIPEGILLSLGLSWNFYGKCPADLDIAAVSFGKRGQFLDAVFFNHTMAGTPAATTDLLRQEYVLNLQDMPYMFLSGDSRTGGEAENRVVPLQEMQKKPQGASGSSLLHPNLCLYEEADCGSDEGKRGRGKKVSCVHGSKIHERLVHGEQEELARETGGGRNQKFGKNDHPLSHAFSQQEKKIDAEFAVGDGRLQYLLQVQADPFSAKYGRCSPFRRRPASISDEAVVFHIGKIPSETEYIFICVTSYTGVDFSRLSEVRLDVFEEILLSSEEEVALFGDVTAAGSGKAGVTLPRRRRLGTLDLKSSTGNGTANLCACLVRVPAATKGKDPGPRRMPDGSDGNDGGEDGIAATPHYSSFPNTNRSSDMFLTTTLHSSVSPSFLLTLEENQFSSMYSQMWDLREINIRAMGYTFVDLLPVMLNMMNVSQHFHTEAFRAVPNYSLRKTPRTSLPLLPQVGGAGPLSTSSFLSSPSSSLQRDSSSNLRSTEQWMDDHLRRQLADLRFGIGWDGKADVDAFCIVLDKKNQYLAHFHPKFGSLWCASPEMAFSSPKGREGNEGWEKYPCRHSGDCVTGVGYAGDGESIDLLVHMLPPEAHVVVLGATLVPRDRQGGEHFSTPISTSITTTATPVVAGFPITSPVHKKSAQEEEEGSYSILEVPGLYLRLQNRPLYYPYAEEVDRWDIFRDAALVSHSSFSCVSTSASHSILKSTPSSTPVGTWIAEEEKLLAPRRVQYAKSIHAHTVLFGALWRCSTHFSAAVPASSAAAQRDTADGVLPQGVAASSMEAPPTSLFASSSKLVTPETINGSTHEGALEEVERSARQRLSNRPPSHVAGKSSPIISSRPPLSSRSSAVPRPWSPATTAEGSSSCFTYLPLRQVVPVEETLSFSGIISYTESLLMLVRHLDWWMAKHANNEKEREDGSGRRRKKSSKGRGPSHTCLPSSGRVSSSGGEPDSITYSESLLGPTRQGKWSTSSRPASTGSPNEWTTHSVVGVADSSTLAAETHTPTLSGGGPSLTRPALSSSVPSIWAITEVVAAMGWGGAEMILSDWLTTTTRAGSWMGGADGGEERGRLHPHGSIPSNTLVPRPRFSSYTMYPIPFAVVFELVEVVSLAPHLPGETHCIGEAWVCGAGPERSPVSALHYHKKWKKEAKKHLLPKRIVARGEEKGLIRDATLPIVYHEVGNWMNLLCRTSLLTGVHSDALPPVPSPHITKKSGSGSCPEGNRSKRGDERAPGAEGAAVLRGSKGVSSGSLPDPSASSAGRVHTEVPLSLSSGGPLGVDPLSYSSRKTTKVTDSGGSLLDGHHRRRHSGGSGLRSGKDSLLFPSTSSLPRRNARNMKSQRACFVVYPFDRIRVVLYSRAAFGVGEISLYSLQGPLFGTGMRCDAGCGCRRHPMGGGPPSGTDHTSCLHFGEGVEVMSGSHGDSSLFNALPGKERKSEADHEEEPSVRGIGPSSVEVVLKLHTPGEGDAVTTSFDSTSAGEGDTRLTSRENREGGGDGAADTSGPPLPAPVVPTRTQAEVKLRLTRISIEECAKELTGQLKEVKKACTSHRVGQANKFHERQRKLFKWFS